MAPSCKACSLYAAHTAIQSTTRLLPSSILLVKSRPAQPCLRTILFSFSPNSSQKERKRGAAAMAGQVSKKELGAVLMQAMMAQKNLRPQRYRLLQLRRRLEQLSTGDGDGDADHADKIKKLGRDLFTVYFIGIEYGSRTLGTCLMLAAERGARLDVNLAFAVMPDEQLHDALLAQRLPARPTTQTEAFSRVEATFNAVKVAQDHHIPRCIEHLVGERPPTVVAAYRGLGKKDRSDKTPAAATATVVDLDKARDYLDRACTLLDLAVKHIDLAVVVISRFMDPKEVASLSEFTDKRPYISEDGPYPSSD